VSEKQQQSLKTVKQYMWWSMGAGLVPLPILDLVAVSGVQVKMLADVSKIYDLPFEKSRVRAVIGSLVGFVVPHALSYGLIGSLVKAVPWGGAVAVAPSMALFCGACTWALGNVFIQHFESGGTFLDFDPDAVKEYFRAQFEEGKKIATAAKAEGQPEAEAKTEAEVEAEVKTEAKTEAKAKAKA
jgi:uncharacterized protein (DUF697 family)